MSSDGSDIPLEISGDYPIKDGVLSGVTAGTTVAQLLERMNNASYLTVQTADGQSASGNLATGMTLSLVVDGTTVDQVTIAVIGDATGDGVVSTIDCRVLLSHFAGVNACTSLQLAAADADRDMVAETSDVRQILISCLL